VSRAIFKMRGRLVVVVEIIGQMLGSTNSQSTTSVKNFGDVDTGDLLASKHAIFGVTSEKESNHNVQSITVGGVALTAVVTAKSGGTPDDNCGIFAGDISSLSGLQTVIVTFDFTIPSAACSGVIVKNLESPIATDTAAATTSGGTNPLVLVGLSAPEAGIVFGVTSNQESGFLTSWSSITKQVDVSTGGAADNHRHSAAWDTGERVSSNEDVTNSSGNKSAVGAGFR